MMYRRHLRSDLLALKVPWILRDVLAIKTTRASPPDGRKKRKLYEQKVENRENGLPRFCGSDSGARGVNIALYCVAFRGR